MKRTPGYTRPWSLHISEDMMAVASSSGCCSPISAACVSKSQLLTQLAHAADGAEEAHLPLTEEAFLLWRQHVDDLTHEVVRLPSEQVNSSSGALASCSQSTRSTDALFDGTLPGTESALGTLSDDGGVDAAAIEQRCQLIIAADIVIDEATKNSLAAWLNAVLHKLGAGDSKHSGDPADTAHQAIMRLPENLLLAVVRLTPLHQALRCLPATFHPASLCAHHPSIDTHRSLTLPGVPPDLLHTSLAATATLPDLQALSLASCTIPYACLACMAILAQLPTITALSLQDTNFNANAADVLAAVLPALPQLHSLDLSRNCMTVEMLSTLSPALRRCDTLRHLDVSHITPPTSAAGAALRRAVHAVEPLEHLTTLSVGFADHRTWSGARFRDQHPAMMAALSLLQTACSKPQLQQLQLSVPGLDPTDAQAECMADALACMPQLRTLELTLPYGKGRSAQAAMLGHAVGSSAHLSCLDLRFSDTDLDSARMLIMHVAGLPSLCVLRLQADASAVARSTAADRVAAAVAEVLPQMTRLSVLHVFAGGRLRQARPAVQLSHRSATQIVDAAAAAPQLRELRLPLCAYAEGMEPLVATLLGAKHLLRLHVELSVGTHGGGVVDGEWRALCRLLPHVCAIDVSCVSAPLRRLPEAATAGALRALRVLSLATVRRVAADEVQGLLSSVSCMSGLQQLRVHMPLLRHRGGNGRAAPLDLGPFCGGLSTLSRLSSLHWDLMDAADAPALQQRVLRACCALTGLCALKIATLHAESYGEFGGVVRQLPLRMLQVRVEEPAAVTAVAEVLRRSPHLREAHLQGVPSPEDRAVLRAAAQQEHACQLEW